MLVDEDWHVLSTGYNGPAPGQTHCIDKPCAGALHPSGQGLELCEAIHAEQNALMTCADPRLVKWVYVTTAPCIHCTKMLLRTRALELFFMEDYPNSGRELWQNAGRAWTHFMSPTIQVLNHLAKGAPMSDRFGEILAQVSARVD